jgi:mannitol-specific phosphotransferase system IIBC component
MSRHSGGLVVVGTCVGVLAAAVATFVSDVFVLRRRKRELDNAIDKTEKAYAKAKEATPK